MKNSLEETKKKNSFEKNENYYIRRQTEFEETIKKKQTLAIDSVERLEEKEKNKISFSSDSSSSLLLLLPSNVRAE